MARSLLSVFILLFLCSTHLAWAQQAEKFKSFDKYAGIVQGIDFFTSKRESVSPYVKPATQAIEKLRVLLGKDLPKGAIFICSTLEQKDSIYEPMIINMGYSWVLSLEGSEIRTEEMMSRMKSMMGDEIPAEIMERLKGRQSDMVASVSDRMVSDTIRKVTNAIIQTSFAQNLRYRSSRLNDMGKSPLPDWIDIGIGVYATGEDSNLSYLLQNMEQTFPIEDILTMSRPFVASMFLQDLDGGNDSGGFGSRGGGGGFTGGAGFPGMGQGGPPQGGFPGMEQGGPPQGGFGGRGEGSPGGTEGQRGSRQRTIPKDEQDQMIFDGQSSTFFAFLLEKVGIEKVRELISIVQEDVEARDFIAGSDMLGDDFRNIENEWIVWVEDQTPQPPFPESGMPKTKERRQTTSDSE